LLILSFCVSCERKPEKAFSEEQCIQRLTSLSWGTEANHTAESFAAMLAIPVDQSYNEQEMDTESFLLVEKSNTVSDRALSYKNPYKRVYPASITKLMTALVCVETVEDLEQEFVISSASSIKVSGSSTAFLQVGESLKIKDLLYGMLLPSGNDAAVAVAEASCGSVDAFVEKMNEEAVKIGALSSHFTNPHGLPDENHYTSPYDIYLIFRAAMQHEVLREILGTKEYQVVYKDRNGARKTQVWKATNLYSTGEKELPEGLKIMGAKTGTTKEAGYCLALDTEKTGSDLDYFSIVMKADTKDILYENMTILLDKIS
jgi:serine-type D-ala-D-ala carboxypeptidase